MKEKYFRPTVTNEVEITNALPICLMPIAVVRKLMDSRSIEKKDGFKILEKK